MVCWPRHFARFLCSPSAVCIHIIILALVQAVCGLASSPLINQAAANPLPGLHDHQRPQQQYETGHVGAVASESSICSQIGIELLREGGNAADAVSGEPPSLLPLDDSSTATDLAQIVGTVFCVGVVGMYHSGIGGGGFMLVRNSSGSYEFIDFRETAPATAFQEMYQNNTEASVFGGLARCV